jgi:hypothetical protein
MQLAYFKATSFDVKTELHTNEMRDSLQPAFHGKLQIKNFFPQNNLHS